MSDKTTYRLADFTAIEPLVNQWAAWSHLVPPAPYSLHLRNYQIEVLRSYLQDPKVHFEICKDPRLRSGPFVDIPEQRAWEVERLLSSTMASQKKNLDFAKSLFDFHNRLAEEAKGQSLESYYQKLPDELAGYVELVYDYYSHPIVRVLESLLYDSPYYDQRLQSLRIFRQARDNQRSFIMSTPRLAEPEQIDWALPFADARVDELFKLDARPQPLAYIREVIGLDPADDELLLSMLSREPVRTNERWRGSAVHLRYFGHACVLIEWQGTSILVDPYIAVAPDEGGIGRFGYSDLPEKIDHLLITHNHHDHFVLETLLRLRHKTEHLVVPRSLGVFHGDLSLKLLARKLGFRNVTELDSLESVPFADGEIIAIPFMGEHADLPNGKTAYVVRAGGYQVMFGADSDCLDRRMYEHIRRSIGPIDTVFLGLECVGAPLSWSSGPFLPVRPDADQEQTRRYKGCDATRALNILKAVGANKIYIYAMGLEPWLEHLLGLALSEDSPQIIEVNRLLKEARAAAAEAHLLYGRQDLYVDAALPESQVCCSSPYGEALESVRSQVGVKIEDVDLPGGRREAPVVEETEVIEDQFLF